MAETPNKLKYVKSININWLAVNEFILSVVPFGYFCEE
jgi:hypothetical protein